MTEAGLEPTKRVSRPIYNRFSYQLENPIIFIYFISFKSFVITTTRQIETSDTRQLALI